MKAAIDSLENICYDNIPGRRYNIVVIDLHKRPDIAVREQIFAIPTVVRYLPQPIKKVIGDLSAKEKALVGLGIPSK
jgi:circadian clock protein KaiB